jgi:glyoxylase-like metal-dependent hydrolase (beta-lactamase superfamily II)
MPDALTFPYPDPPAPGAAVEISPGILWLRLPLPMTLDHVNIYALEDADGWTLVDTGMNSRRSQAIMQAALEGPLRGKPVTRVILTHHHPDHVGLAGWLQQRGAEIVATRTAWLLARMLTLDVQPVLTPQSREFLIRSGTSADLLARKEAERPFNFADVVYPMATGFTRIDEGDVIRAGNRNWRIRLGHGHAPDHATLWSEDDTLIIGGDQFLPGISPNIGVYPTEPMADPLTDWLTSCQQFAPLARDSHLVLPGHKLPFTGLPFRLRQMAENHEQALDRLLDRLVTPHRAVEIFPSLFKREIGEADFGLALAEAVAHLNWLLRRGRVSRSLGPDGAWIWQTL